MILPSTLTTKNEWTFVGPMGPEVPAHLLKHTVLAVDGGARYLSRMDLWIGDSDSLANTSIDTPHKFKHPTQKAQSDLSLALGIFVENLPYKFHFWGLLGGRRDHELFNLGEALSFLERHPGSEIIFYQEKGEVGFHLFGAGSWKFSHEGLFSLGTVKKAKIQLTGKCEYPIPETQELLPLSSLGLSNVGHGELILETDGPVFVHFPEAL